MCCPALTKKSCCVLFGAIPGYVQEAFHLTAQRSLLPDSGTYGALRIDSGLATCKASILLIVLSLWSQSKKRCCCSEALATRVGCLTVVSIKLKSIALYHLQRGINFCCLFSCSHNMSVP